MADLPFWFHPAASTEVLAIHDHYFSVAPELGEDFQNELDRSRLVIGRSPSTWPVYVHGTQRYLMKRFPYFVVFRVAPNRIEIIAITFHVSRARGFVGKLFGNSESSASFAAVT